jgi:formate hydrogenlyase transcriptional activator
MPTLPIKNKTRKKVPLKTSNKTGGSFNKNDPGNLQNTITEKDILLSLKKDIASVRDKKDILTLIHPKLKQLFNTDDIFICCLDTINETLNPVLRVSGVKRTRHKDYERIVNINFPVHDKFIDKVLNSKHPIVFDIEEQNKFANPPGYMKLSKATGLAEILSVALHNAGKVIGILTLWSEKKNFFTGHHKKLIAEIADSISIVIINIQANEATKKRERDNEILLAISNKIAAIRNKVDLGNILSTTLKEYISFDYAAITVYDNTKNTYRIYAYYVEKNYLKNSLFQTVLNAEYPLSDNDLSNPHTPVVVDVEMLINNGNKAVAFISQSGIKEFATIKLIDGNNLIGLFVLLSKQKKSFTDSSLYIMQRISYQISIAVAKLFANEEIERREAEKSLLLSLSNDMALVRGHKDLAKIINEKLKKLFFIKDFTIVAMHENKMTYGAYLYDQEGTPYDKKREYLETLFNSFKFEEGFYDVVLNSNEPVSFNIEEIMKREIVPGHIKFFNSLGIEEIIGMALRIGNEDIGILWIQPSEINSFEIVNQNVFRGVCSQISVALANIIANEEIKIREDEKAILLSLSNEIAAVRDKKDFYGLVNAKLKKLFSIQGFAIGIIDDSRNNHSAFIHDIEDNIKTQPGFNDIIAQKYPVNDGIFDKVTQSDEPVHFEVNKLIDEPEIPGYVRFWKKSGIELIVGVPLRVAQKELGCLFFHLEPAAAKNIRNNLLISVCAQISIALSNILANDKISKQLKEINDYKKQLEEENLYLQEQIETESKYKEIIGSGTEMQKVYHLLTQVAFTNSTVLILGETGTGKELIARAIHNASPRKNRLMVKVNCAALPPNLIESELFGHERGSFTGATDRRIGKFELANKGTLFLDEIGELTPEVQVKLLRALQEKEIERVGGKATIKVDVRIITATNRDLQKEVDEGNFRADLFYRLNVFPINLPALRDRKEDIPGLVSHFMERYSKTTGKKITSISKKAMKQLMAYNWQGNVRELEHLIERTVLINNGNIIKEIHLPLIHENNLKNKAADIYIKTIEENEREHILEVLKKCKGRIFGGNGAAEILGVPVSTLNSKIKKLGIKKLTEIKQ